MKTEMITKKLILLLAAMLPLASLHADEVSPAKAVAKAQQLVAERVDGFDTTVQSVRSFDYEGQKAYYVVQFENGGWAIISADDTAKPLIGYSDNGTYQTENQPSNFKGMMEMFARQVVDGSRILNRENQGWETGAHAAAKAPRKASSNKIAPLIKVKWNQGRGFNKYCPEDSKGPGGHTYAGCVAVGMAQAMSVAKWPDRPVGNYSYTHEDYGSIFVDYDKAEPYNWNNILTGANNKDDVALFLYHCGVAIKMDYGPDGSGTQTYYIPNALVRNFKYPNSVQYFSRDGYPDDWQELILNEVQSGRAVAYSGHDPKKGYGHCFNLDGYDGQWFHVNWGWGGANDGYFSLDGLHDATMDMDYTTGQGVVVGIRAPSDKPSNIILSHSTVLAGKPAGTKVGDVTVETEAENPSFTFDVVGEYSPILHKNLPAPFEVKNGELVTTEANLEVNDYVITITATDNKKNSISRNFTIHVATTDAISTVRTEATTASESIYSPSGAQLSTTRPGLNIIRQRMTDGSVRTVKVIIK